MGECAVCGKEALEGGEFCELHEAARSNLIEAYAKWREAYDGKISFEDFLREVGGIKEAGDAVKEVVLHLLSNKPR